MTLSRLALCAALVCLALPALAKVETLPDATFRIKKGKHEAVLPVVGGGQRLPHVGRKPERTMTFEVLFPNDAIYRTPNPATQGNWGKLMGFTTDFIHINSVRLGWHANPDKNNIALGFYGYLNCATKSNSCGPDVHKDEYKNGIAYVKRDLAEVPLDKWIKVEIHFGWDGSSVEADGHKLQIKAAIAPHGFIHELTSWALHTAYYGGDSTGPAPQDIHIQVRNIKVF